MYDIYSINSLAKAAEKSVMDSKYDKNSLKEIQDNTSSLFNEDEYMLSPWRFADNGWKFVKKSDNNNNKFLNHPNKVNSIGY